MERRRLEQVRALCVDGSLVSFGYVLCRIDCRDGSWVRLVCLEQVRVLCVVRLF